MNYKLPVTSITIFLLVFCYLDYIKQTRDGEKFKSNSISAPPKICRHDAQQESVIPIESLRKRYSFPNLKLQRRHIILGVLGNRWGLFVFSTAVGQWSPR